jgi:hypothetical protein
VRWRAAHCGSRRRRGGVRDLDETLQGRWQGRCLPSSTVAESQGTAHSPAHPGTSHQARALAGGFAATPGDTPRRASRRARGILLDACFL